MGSITIKEEASISGDLRSELIKEWDEERDDPFITGPEDSNLGGGKIIVGSNGNLDEVVSGFKDVAKVSSPERYDYELLPVPEELLGMQRFPMNLTGQTTKTIFADSAFVSLQTSGQANLIFDTSKAPLYIYVEGDLSCSGQSEIRVNGTHPLIFFVGGSVDMSGQFLTSDDATKIILVGASQRVGEEIKISGQASGCSVIYAPNYKVRISGQGKYTGALVSGSATFSDKAHFTFDESLLDFDLFDITGSEGEVTYVAARGTWQKL